MNAALKPDETIQILAPVEEPAESEPSGLEVGLRIAVTNTVTALLLGTSAGYEPGETPRREVRRADAGSQAQQAYLAATGDQPQRPKYPIRVAAAAGRLAIVDKAGQVRWSSDGGGNGDNNDDDNGGDDNGGGGQVRIVPTAVGLEVRFADQSAMFVHMYRWSRKRIIRSLG